MEFYKIFLKKYTQDIHYTLGNKSNVDKYMKFKKANVNQGGGDKAQTPKSMKHWSLAMTEKNKRQEMQAIKATKRCGDAAIKTGVGPGAVVSLQVDYRTHYNPKGLVAIVYSVRRKLGV